MFKCVEIDSICVWHSRQQFNKAILDRDPHEGVFSDLVRDSHRRPSQPILAVRAVSTTEPISCSTTISILSNAGLGVERAPARGCSNEDRL